MYFVICPAMCGGLLLHQIADPAMQAYYIALLTAIPFTAFGTSIGLTALPVVYFAGLP